MLQSLVLCPLDVEPRLSVVIDALGHSVEVTAKLSKHVATLVIHDSQVDEPRRAISVRRHRDRYIRRAPHMGG